MSALKENDLAVLSYIFDPNTTLRDFIYDPKDDSNIPSEGAESSSPESEQAKELEVIGIQLAEEGRLEEALERFSEAIHVAEGASGYNNRAQAYRLKGEEEKALEDLERSLQLSGGKGRSGWCQALCQRGLIYRKLGFDDKARADFQEASLLGSNFAKKQLVEMNPYAAMCNQMMQQILFPKTE